jgi:hypothetical protein
MGLPFLGWAIDRDASRIDSVIGQASSYDKENLWMAGLASEARLAAPSKQWALLAAAGYGQVSPEDMDNVTFWELELGLKCYVLPETSVSLVAQYSVYDLEEDHADFFGGTAGVKQRFIPASEAISPFAFGALSVRDNDSFSTSGYKGLFPDVAVTLGLGCDLMMNDELAFVFEGAYVTGEHESDSVDPDGWWGAFSMKYYWE